MIKKKIKYEDFDGNVREEDHYFSLTKTELTKLQMSVDGGLTTKIERIMSSQSGPEIAQLFSDFIDYSYGVKSDDGKRMIKSKEILDEFKSTNAYDVLFMELVSDTKKAIEFINGIFPAELSAKMQNDPQVLKLINEANEK